MASPSSRTLSTRAKVDGQPLEPNSINEGEGRSRRRRRWTASPSGRTVSTRAKVEVAVAEVDASPSGRTLLMRAKSEVIVEAETMSTGQDSFARRCWSPGPPIAPLVRSLWWRQHGSDEAHFKRRSEFNMATQAQSQRNCSDTPRTQKGVSPNLYSFAQQVHPAFSVVHGRTLIYWK